MFLMFGPFGDFLLCLWLTTMEYPASLFPTVGDAHVVFFFFKSMTARRPGYV